MTQVRGSAPRLIIGCCCASRLRVKTQFVVKGHMCAIVPVTEHFTHTHAHTHTHTCTHTHMHTHTCTHTHTIVSVTDHFTDTDSDSDTHMHARTHASTDHHTAHFSLVVIRVPFCRRKEQEVCISLFLKLVSRDAAFLSFPHRLLFTVVLLCVHKNCKCEVLPGVYVICYPA